MERKRPKGNDATQDLSISDLIVPGKPPTTPPTIAPRGSAGNAKNDMSLWGGVVLGTQDFAPPVAPKRNPKKWIIAGVVGGAVLAVVLYFVFHTTDAKKSDAVAKNDANTTEMKAGAKSDAKGMTAGASGAGASGAGASGAGASSTGASGAGASGAGTSNTAGGASASASGSAAASASGSGAGSNTAAAGTALAATAMPTLMANGKEVDAISGVASVIRAKKAPIRKPVKKTTAKAPVKKAPVKKKK